MVEKTIHIKDAIKQLQESTQFKDWKKEHADSFLANAFILLDDAYQAVWQLSYYNQNNTLTPFLVKDEGIEISDESEIFKKDETKVLELDISKIGLEYDQALDLAKECKDKKYKVEDISKTIIILQHLDIGQVYNFTFLTKTLKTINIKIDSNTGEILHEEVRSLMDFRAKD